jgi:arylformamidase
VLKESRCIDLSHVLVPGKEEYGLELITHNTADLYPQYKVDKETWYILQSINMGSHCGTHIEFPYHHNRHGMDAGAFPFDRLIGPCLLFDFTGKKKNEAVTRQEIEAACTADPELRILPGDMVMFNFGVSGNYGTETGHDRPYIAQDAIRWLADEKKINLIGSDASGIEVKGVPNQPNHQYLMAREIPIIEFANNLGALRKKRFTLFVLALPIVGLDSCPVRLIAVE